MAGPNSTSNLHWNWPWVTCCPAVSFTTQPPWRQEESTDHIWTENIWFSVLPLRASVSSFLNEDKHIHPTRKREMAIHILFALLDPPEHQMRPIAWKSIYPRCFSRIPTRPASFPLNPWKSSLLLSGHIPYSVLLKAWPRDHLHQNHLEVFQEGSCQRHRWVQCRPSKLQSQVIWPIVVF